MGPSRASRESIVATIAGLMLVFTGWAWGGVILWTQFTTFGLGALALLVALTPRDGSSPLMPSSRHGYAVSVIIGTLAAVTVAALDWLTVTEQRASTLQLIPDATLEPLIFADWGLRGLGIGVAVAIAGMFTVAFRTPTQTRGILFRFPPFWIGLALFAYMTVQGLNPWGIVVERDLTWYILPKDPIRWLPSGLAAPLVGDRDPGGMNAWRQMLILAGPWMLLCALRIAAWRRKTLSRLAWVVILNSLAIGAVGYSVSRGTDFSFLGFKNWYAYHAPFGPFIYKNHAGIYLYLSAALALALTAHLIAKKGDRADRGGPHLISGLLFVALCGLAASTFSIGVILAAGLLLLVAPALYFADRNIRVSLSAAPALILAGLGLALGLAVIYSTDLTALRKRIEWKQSYVEKSGTDDRAPLRRTTLAQIKDGGMVKRLYGWGAGSYRWTAPTYFAKDPDFVDAKGRLWKRANYAHNDWLQSFLEWGALGCLCLLAGLVWLATKIGNAWRRRSASLLALSAGLILVLLHAWLDFIFYFTPALTLLALMTAWLTSAEDANSTQSVY